MTTQIDPGLVKALRERTGAGVMDCKRALVEANGDLEQAVDLLRKAGQAKADKKASRVAAEGEVVVLGDSVGRRYIIVEVNSETDFVAKDENFRDFARKVAERALASGASDVETLMSSSEEGAPLEEERLALVAKVGEHIAVRRLEVLETDASMGTYVHMGRIGVLVEVEGGTESLAKDLAMQVAASAPRYVDVEDVPEAEIAKEREILTAQAASEAEAQGKPPEIVEKIVEGRLRKHLQGITLLGQEFVKDPSKRVRELLKAHSARVRRFVRYELGEGIEKKASDFAEEVMAQASRSR